MQKESTQTELRNSSYDQTKFVFKSDLIQILNFQKHVWVGLLDRGDHNEDMGVGFVGFGQSYGYLKNQGQAVLQKRKKK